ncbi:MAG TPA: phosphoribosylaminoimidazolesuccinocarboxamide synthase [Candidatus Limnocylindrales bacterium]|nr:phosphoribosylaminoimidazolesuccinocarboxamide synthase [Candidatus Limnocylindrales bacterium]
MTTFTADRFVRSGKVRDLYELDSERLLLVASDRLSAFDVVLPTVIPDKGKILTGLSRFWFGRTASTIPNHLLSTDPTTVADVGTHTRDLRGRILIVRKLAMYPVEWVVRGFLAGSGWKDYQRSQAISGVALPPGLVEGDRLPTPILTPSTKAEGGIHDEPISFDHVVDVVGPEVAEQARALAMALYQLAASHCEDRGLLLADTKFEFGHDGTEGRTHVVIGDEVLTPDSSRFWDAEAYAPGGPQPSFDKQFVRDWLERQPWDKTDPGPALPDDVVAGTRSRYIEAYERITGASFARYLAEDVVAP